MEGLTTHAPMTDLLRERGTFDAHPFVLIDVGAAGGIDPAWRTFGRTLIARGYDPDVTACEEAQAREAFDNVRYDARFVGLPETHPFVRQRKEDAARWPDTNIWARITAGYLAQRFPASPPAADRPMAAPDTLISVDEIVRSENLSTVDFLKVDVDGPDLEVLESACEVLADSRVLGVGMEVNWFGSANPTEHTFHNTDRFLREQGFALFGLTYRRYSRTALPSPFEYEMYAQTRFGQPYQGDAIYLRDLAADHLSATAATYPPEKLIKLACMYELVGLPDCAAEVLNRFELRLAEFGDREPLLDALTPPLLGEQLNYREYIARFERDPQLFLPSAAVQPGDSPTPVSPPEPPPASGPDAGAQSANGAAAGSAFEATGRRLVPEARRAARHARRVVGRARQLSRDISARRTTPAQSAAPEPAPTPDVASRFAEMHRLVDSPAFDLPLESWSELYELTIAFRPDLVLELGRGYGNSTCVFTEAAHRIGCRVISVGFDSEHAWETQTSQRLLQLVGPDWFRPLAIIHDDITTVDFQPLLAGSNRTLVYWDAHGVDVADAVLGRLVPKLPPENNVVVDDVWLVPEQYGQRAQHQAGPLCSLFDEIVPVWEYLSAHGTAYDTGTRWIAFSASPTRSR